MGTDALSQNRSNLASPAKPSGNRIEALDAIRAFAILTITINHISSLTVYLGRKGANFPTYTHFGFSSAAETFVMVSGLLFGLAYFSKINRYFYHRSIGRMFKIMAANCVLILLIFSVVSMSPTEVGQVTGVSLNGSANWNAITSALTMLDAPFLATILLLYVKVIAILILFRLALRRTRLIVTISLAIYAFSQTRILSGLPWLEGDFNPLSWQLAFVIPAVTAKECAVWLNRSVNGRGFVVAVPFILVILGFVLKASLRYLTDIDLQEQFLFSKSHLGPLRILSAIVSFVFLFQIFSYLQKYFPKLGNIFGAIGANSLETFIASVVAVYVVGALWLLQPSTISYWAFCLAGSLAVGVFGYLFTQWKRMAI